MHCVHFVVGIHCYIENFFFKLNKFNISGFLSTLSCESTTFLLTLITWDRFTSVTKPLHSRMCKKSRVFIILSSLWISAIILSATPLTKLNYFGDNFYGNNGVCLSLHIHDPYAQGWQYSAALFICINAAALIFIFISYFKMLRAIQYSGESIRSTLTGRERMVARRITIIIITDCLCWLPIVCVKILALLGVSISPVIYAWLAVMILPINSALNPVLYSLTTASLKKQV